jgi:hypothetical protein
MDWTHKAPIKLCDRSFSGTVEAEGQEVVVLSKVLAWPDVNTGYQDLGNVEVCVLGGEEMRLTCLRFHTNLCDCYYLYGVLGSRSKELLSSQEDH